MIESFLKILSSIKLTLFTKRNLSKKGIFGPLPEGIDELDLEV